MNMNLRNPFALRNDKVVLIEDISLQEKGLKCDCICPVCKEPFEVKMGDIRRHHFCHSGKGCDEINAYMTGLYMLIKEYLDSGFHLHLPPVIAGFTLSADYCITEANVDKYVELRSRSVRSNLEIVVCSERVAYFVSANIEKNSDDNPQAIIAETRNGDKYAIVIAPPEIVCITPKVKQYKDYNTIEIDLSYAEEIIQNSKKEALFSYIRDNKELCSWVFNSEISKLYPDIIKRSKAYYDAAQNNKQEEERKREEERQIQEQLRKEAERKREEERRLKARIREEKNRVNFMAYRDSRNSETAQQPSKRIPVIRVNLCGIEYKLGDKVKVSPREEYGSIEEISELPNKYHEIKVQYQDGSAVKKGLEVLVQKNLIKKV